MKNIQSGTYNIDATHSNVEFAVKHMMITTVKGRFGDVKGTVEIPEAGEPTVDVTIGVASIDTRVEARDNHLRSPDFFDVEKYPEMRFVSTKAEQTDDGYTLTGDLTLHGVTRPVKLDVVAEGAGVDPWGNQKAAFSATGKFKRSEFGLNWNAALETGGVLVSDDVKLSIDAQLVKQQAKAEKAA
ncbi:MAG TPA: YceI family protein [Gemmatimonadaceae bacterium]